MALSLLVRSQSRAGVNSLLSNISRFSTCAASSTNSSFKLIVNKDVTTLLTKKTIASTAQNPGCRSISLSTPRFSATGDHSKLWTAERAVSAGLLGLLPVALIAQNQLLDSLLAVSIVMHAHWGLEAIVTDYVRPVIFGNTVPKVAHGLLILYSALVLGGLIYFNLTDIGISQAVRKVWAIKGQ